MPTQVYRLKDGTRVPSVTTIISRFKESGGLVHWAWQLGIDGKDYRKVRDEAADAGTLAHALLECDHKGLAVGIDDMGNAYSGTHEELMAKGLTVISCNE